MLQALRTFGRILARHWPLLIAWFLAGEAAHQLLVQLAGTVGGRTTLGGLLLLPLAVAARLVAYVAMYLTVRPSLPHSARADAGGRREFARAILTAILPFSAFYAAWGMLEADQNEFFNIAAAIAIPESGYSSELGDRGGLISVGVLPVAVLVIALVLRLLQSRLQDRLPAWTLALAAYLELLWTFMLFTLVGQWWAGVRTWFGETVIMARLQQIGDWFAGNIVPIASVWEFATAAFGLIIAAVIVPAAWLTVAGVIYGTAFDSEAPRARLRGTAIGNRSIVRMLALRFEDLWAAIALIWRGGPVVFGASVLAYTLWALLERTGTRGLLVAIGGHDTDFWSAWYPLILIGVAVVMEPLRVAVVATAYDTVIGRPDAGLETRPTSEAITPDLADSAAGLGSTALPASPGTDAPPSGLHDEPGDRALVTGHVELERAGGVVGQQEDGEDLVGR